MNKLFICCDREKREKVIRRATSSFDRAVTIVDDINKADMAYVVGRITPEMEQTVKEIQQAGVCAIKVNDNLINEDLYEKVLQGKVRVRDRNAGKER